MSRRWIFFFCLFMAGCGCQDEKRPVVPFEPRSIDDPVSESDDPRSKLLKKAQLKRKFQQADWSREQYLRALDEMARRGETLTTKKREELRLLVNEYQKYAEAYQKSLTTLTNFEKERCVVCMKGLKKIIAQIKKLESGGTQKIKKLDIEKWQKQDPAFKPDACPDSGKAMILFNDGRRFLACSVHGLFNQNRAEEK